MIQSCRSTKDGSTHTHYLGKDIQNELLNLISSQLTKEIVAKIHNAKYFSIILDCTPDISHLEQMSIILRIVELQPETEIKEYFLGFLVVEETTGKNLSMVILNRLKDLQIDFMDCRGQSYDNGSSMKGKKQGI